MKQLNEVKIIKRLLEVEKEIYKQERRLEKLFGNDSINILPNVDIYTIIEEFLVYIDKYKKENTDLIESYIYDYSIEKISLNKAVKAILS